MRPIQLEPGKQPQRSASAIEFGDEALARLQTAAELVGLGWSHWRPGSKDFEWDDRVSAIWGLSPGGPLDLVRSTWKGRLRPFIQTTGTKWRRSELRSAIRQTHTTSPSIVS